MVYNTGYRSGDIPCYIPRISADIPGYIPRISAEEPKEEKASNSATLSPKREVVCVSLSPVKAQKKRKEQTPSPSSARITIDLTAEEEYASFPLTQLSEREPSTYELNEKESIVYAREMYRVWAAPATPNESGFVSCSITICLGHV